MKNERNTQNNDDAIADVDNDSLRFLSRDERVTRDDLQYELSRVNDVINHHVMLCDDLSYWFARRTIIETMINES